MRLIDADKCPCVSCEDTRNAHCTYEHRSCKKFCDWLNTSAYSVDRVVKEIIEEAHNTIVDFKLDKYVYTCKAIEIVKQGGVSDDVCEWKDYKDGIEHSYHIGCCEEAFSQCYETNFKFCPYCGKKIKIVGD